MAVTPNSAGLFVPLKTSYEFLMDEFPQITKQTKYKEEGMELFIKLTDEIGKKNDTKYVNKTLIPVAATPITIGVKSPDVEIVRWNIPPIKPIVVRNKAFKPKGAALTKSNNKPEKNPTVSPWNEPFWIDI